MIAAFTLGAAANAQAAEQVGPAFLGTKGDFLKSQFCEKYKCFPAGTIKLGNNDTEEYFMVVGFKTPEFGVEKFLVFFTKCETYEGCRGEWTRAGIRYAPTQESVNNRPFAKEFFGFVTGVSLKSANSGQIFNSGGCSTDIRGRNEYFRLDPIKVLSYGGASEETIVAYVNGGFSQASFGSRPESVRLVTATGESCY
ncbi:hypothetical protein GCM10017783_23790 [Deinococcus piscis]|uniref:Uncharacterized protein n=1 Tax=Deinococcus piscis TaxID=394230 RepID=A0ABQ3KBE0_9DEIO|nr:hypothetical protein GCM10017783_23790 [Deinococcus piscis]